MITHAYVRYEDDKRHAIVSVSDIKNFSPDEDFSSAFFMVKWTDESGGSDYYRARILLVGDSEEDIQRKKKSRRIRVRRIFDSDESGSEEDVPVEPPKKKKKEHAHDHLLSILTKKKNALKASDASAQQDSEENALQNALQQIKELKKKVAAQEEELQELRKLNRNIQALLIQQVSSAKDGAMPVHPLQPAEISSVAQATLSATKVSSAKDRAMPVKPLQPAEISSVAQAVSDTSTPPPAVAEVCLPDVHPLGQQSVPLPAAENVEKVDVGNGLFIALETWKRIQLRPKDSMFVKDLLVAVWGTASLQGRSLQGKHCPRFPDRPRKLPLTPEKVAAVRECFKERLRKRGVPSFMLESSLQQFNHYVVEKLADIDRMYKKAENK